MPSPPSDLCWMIKKLIHKNFNGLGISPEAAYFSSCLMNDFRAICALQLYSER